MALFFYSRLYTYYHLELGEISSYPEGYKENAGIFCHNNPWVSIAETVLGHGNRAFEIYKKSVRHIFRISATCTGRKLTFIRR